MKNVVGVLGILMGLAVTTSSLFLSIGETSTALENTSQKLLIKDSQNPMESVLISSDQAVKIISSRN